ncbi:hypothetical protein [Arsenicicoccus dermatophilus]|uniref:hypothetical protein n=1 Tax=Arsenicicoccus dermatophilus TaxID=1076331 RepID=UPI0039172F09
MTDLLEQQLRTDLRDAADSLPPEATRLVHPALLGPEADLDQEWGVEELPRRARLRRPLAVAASVAAAAGLTAGVVVAGPRLTGAPPAVTPARVQQAITDLRAIEHMRPRLEQLQQEEEARCMAARGFPIYVQWSALAELSPESALSGARDPAQARRLGYGLVTERRRQERFVKVPSDYLVGYSAARSPGETSWSTRLRRAGMSLLADRVPQRPGCAQQARDEVWGEDAAVGRELEDQLYTRLSEAMGYRVLRGKDHGPHAQVGALSWRRCMLADPAVAPAGTHPDPRTSLPQWLAGSLRRDAGTSSDNELVPRSTAQLTQAAARERAVAVRDVVCSRLPEVRREAAAAERFQMELALRSAPPDTVDLLPRWRAALERVLARH